MRTPIAGSRPLRALAVDQRHAGAVGAGGVRLSPAAAVYHRRSALIEAHAAELVALVETTPDITLAEIADHLFAAHGKPAPYLHPDQAV
jgi:hypothetical protein